MQAKKNSQVQELFTNAPPAKVFLSLSLPVVLSMVVTLIYNMVDTYFVGQLGDANQMAAVSLCTPLFTLVMGMGNIFGIGGSSVVSRLMGSQQHDKVRKASSLCLYVSAAAGALMLVLMLSLREVLLPLLGTSTNTISYTRDYFTWFILGAPILMLQFTLMNLLRCDGCARESMIGSIIGSVVNVILDPIMIFTLGLGVSGAAIATVIGNLCTVLFFLYAAHRHARDLSFSPRNFTMDWQMLGNIFAIGLPACITNTLTSVATVLMNNFLLPYGDTAIAAQGIALKINQIVILIQIGFAGGLPPVFGYNWGAGNTKRLRQLLRSASLFALCLGTVLTVIVYALAPAFVRFFMDTEAIIIPGTQLLRGLMLCGPFLGILFIINNFFQASGKAVPATLLSLCRQGIVFVAVLFSFNYFFGWQGLVYTQPAADYLSLVIALLLFAKNIWPVLRADR